MDMLKIVVLGMTLAAALVGSTAVALAADAKGEQFIKAAIQGNMAEVKVGQLAQQKGQSADAKKFGQMLEKDHGDANTKAMQVAKQMNVTAPPEPNAKQKEVYDKLSKLSGDAFDREFAKEMVEDHQKDIKEYEDAAKMTDAAGSYAKETLPHLQMHLQMAQGLEKSTSAPTVGSGAPKGK